MSIAKLEPLAHDAGATLALDRVLVAQLIVAWAGEGGEDEPRMGWWRTDLLSTFGGEDLFARLLPYTWQWGVLRAVREAARRREAVLIERHHDPDRIVSLFHLGFAVDERVAERLSEFERSQVQRAEALPRLHEMITAGWDRGRFLAWIREHASHDYEIVPTGRRLRGPAPADLEERVSALVGALDPLAEGYPLPHFALAEGSHA